MPVWLYHPGDNPEWAKPEFNDEDWDTLSTGLALRNKKEDFFPGIGWFRIHLEIDSSLMNKTFALTMNQRGASQVYHNGELIKESGTIGTDTVKEVRENPKDIPIIIHFDSSRQQVLAVRYSHKEAFQNLKKYNEENSGFVIRISYDQNCTECPRRSDSIIYNYFIVVHHLYCAWGLTFSAVRFFQGKESQPVLQSFCIWFLHASFLDLCSQFIFLQP